MAEDEKKIVSDVPTISAKTIKDVHSVVEALSKDYIYLLSRILEPCCEKHGVNVTTPSNQILIEIAENCARDLVKLSIYQNDEVNPIKTFGYICFWVRKLKPMEATTYGENAVKDINEKLSIWLMEWLIDEFYSEFANDAEHLKAKVIRKRFKKLINSPERMTYLVHCLRNRTFGPHHYALLLDQITHT